MNLTKIAAFLLILSFFKSSDTQTVSPAFKQLILLSYRPVDSGARESIRIESYYEVNEDGTVRHINNRFFGDVYKNLTYHGDMTDTTYKLPDVAIADLNKVFNGTKKLKDFLVTDNSGGNFAGPYEFLSYKTRDSKKEDMVIITANANPQLYQLLEKLWHLKHARTYRSGVVYRNRNVEAQILKVQKANKDIPEIAAPPPVEFLVKPGSH